MFFHRRVRFNLAINAVETDAAEISILQSRLQRAKWLSIGHLIDLSELLRRTSPEEWNFHESRERATEFVVDCRIFVMFEPRHFWQRPNQISLTWLFSPVDTPAGHHRGEAMRFCSRSRYDLRALIALDRPCFQELSRPNPA